MIILTRVSFWADECFDVTRRWSSDEVDALFEVGPGFAVIVVVVVVDPTWSNRGP